MAEQEDGFLNSTNSKYNACSYLRYRFASERVAEQTGVNLNSLFAELADWEAQLKPLDSAAFEETGGAE